MEWSGQKENRNGARPATEVATLVITVEERHHTHSQVDSMISAELGIHWQINYQMCVVSTVQHDKMPF
jgi:hypothetical protein